MKTSVPFRITALPVGHFAPLFPMSDTELAEHNARRYIADKKPGFPCRVSLVDAEPGEHVILVPFSHHGAASPYQASGPIFVREAARQAILSAGEVPESVRGRLLSIRAYDAAGLMINAEVAEGGELEVYIDRFFADPRVAYLHLHNARPGCYSCRVERVVVEKANESNSSFACRHLS
jgi:hypothetical protein